MKPEAHLVLRVVHLLQKAVVHHHLRKAVAVLKAAVLQNQAVLPPLVAHLVLQEAAVVQEAAVHLHKVVLQVQSAVLQVNLHQVAANHLQAVKQQAELMN